MCGGDWKSFGGSRGSVEGRGRSIVDTRQKSGGLTAYPIRVISEPKNFNENAQRTRAQRPPGARFAGLSIGLISPAHYSTDATPVVASRVACESDAGFGRGQNTAIGRSSPGRGRRRQSSRRWRTRRRERRRGEPRWAWHRRHARRGSQPSRGRRSGARWPRRSSPA